MASPNRTAILNKLYKTLKKLYTPTPPNLKMPLLEQVLYACCLEDATPAAAAKAFAALDEQYFDWNEVRVSTVTELSETISMLPEPVAAASRVKRVLQSVFESAYAFDLEALKKQNIGAAQKRLEKYDGVTQFSVAYATQTGLGGHMIPLGRGALDVLYVIGAINEKERAAGEVPGMERAIPKNKGIEFGSLLNQLGVEYARSPQSPAIRKLLLSIAPDAKDRFAKRVTKPEPVAEAPPAPPPPADGKAKAGKDAAVAKGKGKPEPAPVAKKGTPPAKAPVPSKPAVPGGKAVAPTKPKATPPAAKKPAAKPPAKSPPSRTKGPAPRVAPRKPR
jgi:endonuclease-3